MNHALATTGTLLDGGSLLYFSFGVVSGLTRLPWWAVLGLGIGAKVVSRKLDIFDHEESIPAAAVDVAALIGGYGVMHGVRDLGLLAKFGFPPAQEYGA